MRTLKDTRSRGFKTLFEYDLILKVMLRAPNRNRTQGFVVIKLFHSRTPTEYKTAIF